MEDIYLSLQEGGINKKDILKDEPMSNHTSFKIGGNADFFINITSIKNLKFVLEFANKNNIPITVVGNGTNLLVTEKGIRGITIKLDLKDFKIEKSKEDVFITVEAGFALSKLANIALKEELEGLEFLAGIPGTVGGAIRMNAGAYGKEMKDILVKTRYMTYDGKIKTIDLEEHNFEYRNSIFSKINVIILETVIKVKRGKKEEIQKRINEYMQKRIDSQPLEFPNAGSTFKRKEGIITAKIIDECGLKGYSIGDAEVSNKHAGFIINKGKATSKDILNLVAYVKKVVKEKKNVDIELEILVLGEN